MRRINRPGPKLEALRVPMACQSILIVEDDEAIRESMREILEFEQYRVFTAANGQEAIDLLHNQVTHPCLILLDLMMPVMSGWEFLAAIKNEKFETLATIPIVLVSASGDAANQARKETAGFIKKPINLDTLLQMVQQHCGQQAA